MKKADKETSVKHVLSFLILLVAFGMLIVFSFNSDQILGSSDQNVFIILLAVGLALLLGLLFLVSQSKLKVSTRAKKRKRS